MCVKPKFAQWAVGFSGMDGGNLDARLWICGIEWGGELNNNPVESEWPYYYIQNEQKIPCWNTQFIEDHREEIDGRGFGLDKKIAKLLFHIFGPERHCADWKDYMKNHLYTQNGDCFKFNLFLLKKPRAKSWINRHREITGLERKAYYNWCRMYRFPFIRDLVNDYHPKVVLATGITYRDDFIRAIAGCEVNPNEVYQFGGNGSQEITVEEIVTNNGRTHLLITWFLNRVSNQNIQAIAGLIEQILNQHS
ncbi:MAG: hypothetical protein ABIK47_04745 [candidate division WOR-3 bacterium]